MSADLLLNIIESNIDEIGEIQVKKEETCFYKNKIGGKNNSSEFYSKTIWPK